MQIRMLSLLLLFQCLASCQSNQEKVQPLEASVRPPDTGTEWLNPIKSMSPASDIVYRSDDGGQTWQDVSEGLPKDLGVSRVYIENGEIFLNAEKALYHGSTTSAAPHWQHEAFYDTKISDIFPGRSGPYVSSYQNGVFKKVPGTDVLIPMHNNLKDKTVRTVLESPDGAVFVGCESGLYKTTDGGISWKQVISGTGINSLAEAEGVLICGTYEGLFRSPDGGERWDMVLSEEGPAFKTGYFEGRFVTIAQGGRNWQDRPVNKIYVSADGARTWQRMDEGLAAAQLLFFKEVGTSPIVHINDLKMAGQYLFCSCDAGIFRSSDWGKSWEPVFGQNGMKLLQLGVSGKVIYAVKVVGC